jgi:hypothetical protein
LTLARGTRNEGVLVSEKKSYRVWDEADQVLGLLRWMTKNITMTMSNVPIIASVYYAATADGAVSWPDTEVPGAVVIPE